MKRPQTRDAFAHLGAICRAAWIAIERPITADRPQPPNRMLREVLPVPAAPGRIGRATRRDSLA